MQTKTWVVLALSATVEAAAPPSKAVEARQASELAKAKRYADLNAGYTGTRGERPFVTFDDDGWATELEASPATIGGSEGWASEVDLRPLQALTHLQVVTWHRHRLDLAPLLAMPQLEALILDDCEVKSWAVLARLRSLETVKIRGRTPSRDELAAIAALPNLKWLEVAPLDSLEPLAAAKGLRVLDLGASPQLVSLDGLQALTGLEEVYGERTGVRDASPAAGLPRLKALTLDYRATFPQGFVRHEPTMQGFVRRWRSAPPDMLLATSVKAHRVDDLQRALAKKAPLAPNPYCTQQNCLVESLLDEHQPGLDLLIAAATPEELAQPLRESNTLLTLMLKHRCARGECASQAAALVKRGASTQARDDRNLTAQQLACLSGFAELEAALGKVEGPGRYAVGQRVRLHHQWAADGTVARRCGDGYAVQSDKDAFMGGALVLVREDRLFTPTSPPADPRPTITVSPSSSSSGASAGSSPEYIVPPSSGVGRSSAPSYRAKRCLEDCSANCRAQWNQPGQGNNDYLRSTCVESCVENCRD